MVWPSNTVSDHDLAVAPVASGAFVPAGSRCRSRRRELRADSEARSPTDRGKSAAAAQRNARQAEADQRISSVRNRETRHGARLGSRGTWSHLDEREGRCGAQAARGPPESDLGAKDGWRLTLSICPARGLEGPLRSPIIVVGGRLVAPGGERHLCGFRAPGGRDPVRDLILLR